MLVRPHGGGKLRPPLPEGADEKVEVKLVGYLAR